MQVSWWSHQAIWMNKVHWFANADEIQVCLELVERKCLDDKCAKRAVVRIKGRNQNNGGTLLHFAVQLEYGTDEVGDACPELPISALLGPCWYTKNFFCRVMPSTCRELPISLPFGPWWWSRNSFLAPSRCIGC